VEDCSTQLPVESLRELGVFSPTMLSAHAKEDREYLVEGLLFKESVNLAVGDSGLGKTALLVSLGIAVASGRPWLGRATEPGRVLFADGESPISEFHRMIESVSLHLGLQVPPDDFTVFNPNWSLSEKAAPNRLADVVRRLKPSLVIVDPLRVFWDQAEGKSTDTMQMVKFQRQLAKEVGCAWITLHHRRKQTTDVTKQPVGLESDPMAWLQEAAGARALVNNTDTRIGIDKPHRKGADLVVAGFIRLAGSIPPIYVTRDFDEDGDPLGYRLLGVEEQLDDEERGLVARLPASFRYRDVKALSGWSRDQRVSDFLKLLVSVGLVHSTGEGKEKRYHRSQEQPPNTAVTH
jgi:hypothetical protein